MATNKKPRKKYRPRPLIQDTIAWALAGVKTMAADKGAMLAKQVRNSDALTALWQAGFGTEHSEILIRGKCALLGNIESPFNACMHQEHCKRWKKEAEAEQQFSARDDAERLKSVARGMSYNDHGEAVWKHTLMEIAVRLEAGGYAAPQPPTTEQSSVVEQPQGERHPGVLMPSRSLVDQVIREIARYCNTGEMDDAESLLASLQFSLDPDQQPPTTEDCSVVEPPKGEQEPVAEQKSGSDMISVPRSLLGAACSAINRKQDAPKVLEQLRRYTVGDLSKSSVVEQQQEQEWKHRLGNLLAVIHGDGGHYIDAHGWDKAQVDAEEKIARIMTERSQPVEQEPVVWAVMQDGAICWEADYSFSNEPGWCDSDQQSVPLYTHPQPKREPLTDEQWLKRWTGRTGQRLKPGPERERLLRMFRFAERAHGIGGEA